MAPATATVAASAPASWPSDALNPAINTRLAAPAVAWETPADDSIARRELRELVLANIHQLPESYRNVLLLRDIEEFDTQETAELAGISPNAVKTRLHRARLALRGLLEPTLGKA